MRRVWYAIVAFTVLAGQSGQAADLPRATMPAKAPVIVLYNWSGFYVGINGGYGWGGSNWRDLGDGSTTGNFNVSGGVLGGTLGYNMQTGAWVLGVEGDLDWSNIKGDTAVTCGPPNCQTRNDWLATFRGRLGYAWDRLLPYVTAGAAAGNIRAGGVGLATDNKSNVGWTAGVGLEAAVAGPWTAKVEWLYVDLGKMSCSIARCTGAGLTDVKFNTHLLRAGLNYRF